MKTVFLPPPKLVYFRHCKSIFGRGHIINPASKKTKAQHAQMRPDSRFKYKYRNLGFPFHFSFSLTPLRPTEPEPSRLPSLRPPSPTRRSRTAPHLPSRTLPSSRRPSSLRVRAAPLLPLALPPSSCSGRGQSSSGGSHVPRRQGPCSRSHAPRRRTPHAPVAGAYSRRHGLWQVQGGLHEL
jgi:hypothetical protein